MHMKVFLAIDLGAGSGRVMAGLFDGKKIDLQEVARWNSAPVKIGDSYHWDVNRIFSDILVGLRAARAKYGDAIESLGIDTWGVDYGLLDGSDKLLNMPYIYRDTRTEGMMDWVFSKVSKDEIYKTTGIQFMFFNTIFQLASEIERGGNIDKAKTFLMMPDLLAFMLTGVKKNERTNASTTQFYNPFKRDWAYDILNKIGVSSEIFASGFAECGTVIGGLLPEIKNEIGDIKVVAVASHDTGSAVAAMPTQAEGSAYVNSGTWSLAGIEADSPIVSEESFKENFTNEVGVGHKIRFLKNVTGMWLVQKCKEIWKSEGTDMSYANLERGALESPAMRTIFDPDHQDFVMPENMPEAIRSHCRQRGIPVPENHGQIFRAIQESIAAKYAYIFSKMESLSGKKISQINIMGGGSKDAVLSQFAADATNRTVYAGPVESTALGNILMQLKACGGISNLSEGRAIVANSCMPKVYNPRPEEVAKWKEYASSRA